MKKIKIFVVKNILFLVYNEVFVFDVLIDCLSDVSLLVCVFDFKVEEGE